MDELNNGDEPTGRGRPAMSPTSTGHHPVPGRARQSALSKKLIPGVFVGIVSSMVAISFILSIVRSIQNSSVYLLLGISLIGLLVIQIIMVLLAKSGGIPRQKTWFVYLVGLCIVIESILTNVVLFG